MLGYYLTFNRTCAAALELYARLLDGRVTEIQTYGGAENPGFPVPEGDRDLVLHARLALDGAELMCADSSEPLSPGDNMYVSVTSADAERVKRAFAGLAEGGEVRMELTPTFFGALHGSLRDPYGVNWMFTVTG
jgi:PhnB protein